MPTQCNCAQQGILEARTLQIKSVELTVGRASAAMFALALQPSQPLIVTVCSYSRVLFAICDLGFPPDYGLLVIVEIFQGLVLGRQQCRAPAMLHTNRQERPSHRWSKPFKLMTSPCRLCASKAQACGRQLDLRLQLFVPVCLKT